VVYEPERQSAAAIRDAVARHSGLDVPSDLAAAQPPVPVARTEPGSALTGAVMDGFGELDQRVQRATRGLLGLAGLVPLALSAWAVRQIARGRVTPIAWSTALWYAHSIFRDYNARAPRE
jgi:hypothetical protein